MYEATAPFQESSPHHYTRVRVRVRVKVRVRVGVRVRVRVRNRVRVSHGLPRLDCEADATQQLLALCVGKGHVVERDPARSQKERGRVGLARHRRLHDEQLVERVHIRRRHADLVVRGRGRGRGPPLALILSLTREP